MGRKRTISMMRLVAGSFWGPKNKKGTGQRPMPPCRKFVCPHRIRSLAPCGTCHHIQSRFPNLHRSRTLAGLLNLPPSADPFLAIPFTLPPCGFRVQQLSPEIRPASGGSTVLDCSRPAELRSMLQETLAGNPPHRVMLPKPLRDNSTSMMFQETLAGNPPHRVTLQETLAGNPPHRRCFRPPCGRPFTPVDASGILAGHPPHQTPSRSLREPSGAPSKTSRPSPAGTVQKPCEPLSPSGLRSTPFFRR